jgi:hypothetical protein
MDPATLPQTDTQPEMARGQADRRSVDLPVRAYKQSLSYPVSCLTECFSDSPTNHVQDGNNVDLQSLSHELMPAKTVPHQHYPDDHEMRDEFSENGDPVRPSRKPRQVEKEGRRQLEGGRTSGGYYSQGRPSLRKPQQTSSKTAGKQRHKPGAKAQSYAHKTISKNDMTAKKELIREIEVIWGKGFIKAWIPKCHRPLVKRGMAGTRGSHREHESNPKNWMPSILKAILSLTKLKPDKEKLAQTMNEVVRYRIKHTGNRKPQLVTTDFDVIEDVLDQDWTVAYSFGIRYKRLLGDRKLEEISEDNIDRILDASSDGDDSNQSENGDADSSEEDDDDDGSSAQYAKSNSYIKRETSQLSSMAPVRQQKKLRMDRQGHSPEQHQGMHGWGGHPGYGPVHDGWAQSMPMPGYGGRPGGYNNNLYDAHGGGFGGYGGYGLPPYGQDPRQGPQQPLPRGMPYPSPRQAITPAPSMPDSEYHNPFKRGRFSPHSGGHARIKRESSIDEPLLPEQDSDDSNNALGAQDGDDSESDNDIDVDIKTAELKLQLAELKALKKARMAGRRRRS